MAFRGVAFLLVLLACASAKSGHAGSWETKKMYPKEDLEWYLGPKCESMEIAQFVRMGDSKPAKVKSVDDEKLIQKVLSLLDQLPSEGTEFIKWGHDVGVLCLTLTCGSRSNSIRFFDGRIKTPATSFISGNPPAEHEIFPC